MFLNVKALLLIALNLCLVVVLPTACGSTIFTNRELLRRTQKRILPHRYTSTCKFNRIDKFRSNQSHADLLGAAEVDASPSKLSFTLSLAGYAIGLGAFAVYAPILIKILKAGNADGFALSTWVFNLLGMVAAASYPAKKGFPLATYSELISLAIQSAVILCVISFYKSQLLPFFTFMATLSAGLYLFYKHPVPPKILASIQIAGSLLCNYANIPQIVLNYQTKVASWDIITASLCVVGNFARIITSIFLTKDLLITAGFALGFLTNSILLAQIFIYR